MQKLLPMRYRWSAAAPPPPCSQSHWRGRSRTAAASQRVTQAARRQLPGCGIDPRSQQPASKCPSRPLGGHERPLRCVVSSAPRWRSRCRHRPECCFPPPPPRQQQMQLLVALRPYLWHGLLRATAGALQTHFSARFQLQMGRQQRSQKKRQHDHSTSAQLPKLKELDQQTPEAPALTSDQLQLLEDPGRQSQRQPAACSHWNLNHQPWYATCIRKRT